MRVAVLALGVAVIVLAIAAMLGGQDAVGQAVEEIERSFQLAPGQEIVVENRNGGISYEAWDGDEVVIRAVKQVRGLIPYFSKWAAERVGIEINQVSSGVRAVHRFDLAWFTLATVVVHFDVRVPRGWEGDVSLRTSNGRVVARDLHGDARLRTSNGAIVVERQSGSLAAKTSNGRIELKEVSGVVEAETSNGAVIVDGATLTQTGRLRTSNGAVSLRARLERGASYEVRTSNGRVTLALAEPDVQLDLQTSNGEIELQTEVLVTEVGRTRLAGRIGDGAARLSARTSNGDITVSAF